MFSINFLLLFALFLIISCFIFFHLYSQGNTFEFSIFNFIINNVQILLLSTDTDNYDLIQNINGENNIETKKYDIKKQIISINKNYYHDADEYISIGVWVPLNNSLILHLKQKNKKMQYILF